MSPRTLLRLFTYALCVCSFILLISQVARPIDLTVADLGRHLQNGRIIWETKHVTQTNLFSYTYPNFRYIDHHWASEVLFFVIHKIAGFKGLSVFFILATVVTYILCISLARHKRIWSTTLLISLIVIPLIGARHQIRPEIFTNLFVTLFIYILIRFRDHDTPASTVYLLPFLEILWVNLHIYFFLGPTIVCIFFLGEVIHTWKSRLLPLRKKQQPLLIAFFTTTAATIINPHGIYGAIQPMLIYGNYGLKVVEEQPVWIISYVSHFPAGTIFYLVVFLFIVSWILRVFYKRHDITGTMATDLIISIFFCVFGAVMIRNMAIFGYMALIYIPMHIAALPNNLYAAKRNNIFLAVCFILFLIVFSVDTSSFFRPFHMGIGLQRGTDTAAHFFTKNTLRGPIFNNYDIGSYLIYYLYPQETVFIDNNPNNYPDSFLRNEYIPIIQHEEAWLTADKAYNFNTIFFTLSASDVFQRPFLISRITDPRWVTVYIDDNKIILVKKNSLNQAIIQNHEIPAEKILHM
jgi:hypothetical protein